MGQSTGAEAKGGQPILRRLTPHEAHAVLARLLAVHPELVADVVRGPAVIGRGAVVRDSFIGPYTSVGDGCRIERSRIEHCVILAGAVVEGVEWLEDSLIGRNAVVRRDAANHRALRLLIGDDAEVAV